MNLFAFGKIVLHPSSEVEKAQGDSAITVADFYRQHFALAENSINTHYFALHCRPDSRMQFCNRVDTCSVFVTQWQMKQ